MHTERTQESNGDHSEIRQRCSDCETEENQDEIYCGSCGKAIYTEEEIYERFGQTIAHGLDNPFLCGECREEYEALAPANL
jgi:hypothetical protein